MYRSSSITSLGLAILAAATMLQLGFGSAAAQSFSSAAKSELAPTGKLRVAFPLNGLTAPKNPSTGELGGTHRPIWARIGAQPGRSPYEPVEFATPGKFIEVAGGDLWDLTLMSPDPARAMVADWSSPVLELDYTYLVGPNSKLIKCDEVDRAGLRVGAVRGDAQELAVACVEERRGRPI